MYRPSLPDAPTTQTRMAGSPLQRRTVMGHEHLTWRRADIGLCPHRPSDEAPMPERGTARCGYARPSPPGVERPRPSCAGDMTVECSLRCPRAGRSGRDRPGASGACRRSGAASARPVVDPLQHLLSDLLLEAPAPLLAERVGRVVE